MSWRPAIKKLLVQAIVGAAMLAAAGGAWWFFYFEQPQAEGAPGPAAQGAMAVPVETAPVQVGPIQRRLTAVGSLRSNESVIVRPEVAGRIAEIRFDEGERVTKGQPLVVLDDSIYRAEVEEVQASLELSRANHERAIDLLQRGAGTTKARDEALARLRADEAALQLAKAHLDKMVIAAPFEGVVGLRKVSVGDFVNVGQDMVNLEQIDPLKADFRVAEVYLGAVRPGQRIELGVDAFPGETFAGEVYAIDPLIDESGRSVVLRARLPNPDDRLRPGLFARVTLVLNERNDAIQVPEQALVPQGQDQFVFRVVDGKAALTRVEVGIRREGMVEITEGLGPEDEVVTAGQLKVRDGAPVKPLSDAEA
ncbi:MAG TPA: efflux RND transporter periplasmic adaptor subunit [Geminicoccaceae bacterium]|nr:efflux RND transporter periplasmic adaptor subunit [Geminicoccaceae bacterium]